MQTINEASNYRSKFALKLSRIAVAVAGLSNIVEGNGFFTFRLFRFCLMDRVKATEASCESQKPHVKGIIAKTTKGVGAVMEGYRKG